MHLCRIAGIPLSLHWSFLALLVFFGWEGWATAEWLGFTWVLGYAISVFTCVVLHELGHSLVARRFGIEVPGIMLLPIGGVAEFDRLPESSRSEILIALAGPAVNGAIAIVLYLVGVRFPAGWDALVFPLTMAEFGRHLLAMNIAMGFFNLLPIFPMDGGRVFRAVLSLQCDHYRATRVAAGIGKVLAVVGITVMLFALPSPHLMGALLFGFIFMAGEMEVRGLKEREIQEKQWQETIERYYQQTEAAVRLKGAENESIDSPEKKNSLPSNPQL
jgi:Zn-dependent protease